MSARYGGKPSRITVREFVALVIGVPSVIAIALALCGWTP